MDQNVKQANFDEQFKRLKSELGVYSNTQLGKKLGINPQAVYAAKRRCRIPNKWIDKALKNFNISVEYVFEGVKDSDEKNDISMDIIGQVPEKYQDKLQQIASDIIAVALDQSEEAVDPFIKSAMRERIKQNIVQNAVLKSIASIKAFNVLREKSLKSEKKSLGPVDIDHEIDAILGKLN